MRREGSRAHQVVRLPVRLSSGEEVRLVGALHFAPSGAVVDVRAILSPPPASSEAERQAAMLVDAIAAKLRRRPDIGVAELRRRAECALALLELLEELEDVHGAEARAQFVKQREAAA